MSAPRPGGYAAAAASAIREHQDMRASVTAATRNFDGNRAAAWREIDADAWRDWARDVKRHVLTHLDRYLEEAEARLLANAGATVAPWEAAEECCGFGGLFSVKLPVVSAGMADRKLDTLPAVDWVTSADGGCLMQLSGRAAHRGLTIPFRHLASVLWEAAA